MAAIVDVSSVLGEWKGVLGERFEPGEESAGRELWPVTAEDGTRYFLKRLSQWRNLPLADEARVLRHLAESDVPVAEFLVTDGARLFAGTVENAFVLVPRLVDDQFDTVELVELGRMIGAAWSRLHLALASYPRPANSYVERLGESLARELMLPIDVSEAFARQRREMISALERVPTQLIHGDLTPENVLLQRPGGVSGFIDFDHLPIGPRVFDIGKFLSRRIRLRWRASTSTAEVGRLDHLAGFLAGYVRVSPLTPAEVDALPFAVAAANILEVSYLAEISAGTLPRRKLLDHDEVLTDTIEAARWHLVHTDEVDALIRKSVA